MTWGGWDKGETILFYGCGFFETFGAFGNKKSMYVRKMPVLGQNGGKGGKCNFIRFTK